MRQSNLLLHFLSMVKFVVRSFGVEECLSRKCLPIEEDLILSYPFILFLYALIVFNTPSFYIFVLLHLSLHFFVLLYN